MMKLNGYISTGNIIVIATILVSISIAWGSMNASLAQLRAEVEQKAPKNVTDVKFEYIHKELIEIKQMLEIVFTKAQ
jgi:KaiC/GvpD/RAD55 family RecA-like ATPase